MPNRYAGPEDFSDSRALAKVSLDAVAFYASIFFTVDDFGRMVSDPAMLKARAFPYRQEIRGTDCSRWLAECERAGLLASYEVDGTPYLQLTAFSGTRFKRATKSKCPEPPAIASNCVQLRADASNCPVPVPGTDYGTDTPLPPTGGLLVETPKLGTPKRRRTKPPGPELYGDPLFAEFWNGYPNKTAKGQAWTTWLQMAPADQKAAAKQSPVYGGAYEKADDERKRFVPNPSTWLNARSYEDDPAAWYVKAGTTPPPKKPKRDFAGEIRHLEGVLNRMLGEQKENARLLAEGEAKGTLTDQGRANMAMFMEDDVQRVKETRSRLEALKAEALRG